MKLPRGMDSPVRLTRRSSRLSLSRSIKNNQSSAGLPTGVHVQHGSLPLDRVSRKPLDENYDQSNADENVGEIAQTESKEHSERSRTPPSIISISDDSDDVATPKEKTVNGFSTPVNRRNTVPSKWSPGTSTSRKSTHSGTSSRTDPKKLAKVRRKIGRTSNIKMLTKKHFDENQKRIPDFFRKPDDAQERIGYMQVLKSSVMPTIVTGDIDVESMLGVELREGNETLHFTQCPQPMATIPEDPAALLERIEKMQSACIDPVLDAWNMEDVPVPIVIPEPLDSGSAKDVEGERARTCTDLGAVTGKVAKPTGRKQTARKRTAPVKTTPANGSAKRKGGSNVGRKVVICPKYKIVAGTNFAVDGFRYGDIAGVTHYFLTHFHADHYIGLKKSFAMPLVMSEITARLVKAFINVDERYYITVELHKMITIDGVQIVALDANHCPGAVMFLFRLQNGTSILHTGDFRASPEMEEYPEFWNVTIDCIYLDTTYLSSKYAFKPQWESVNDALRVVKDYRKSHVGAKVLIICGSYVIGKEKVWMELAATYNMKVWTEPHRWKALKAIAEPDQLRSLVADPDQADIHVLSMNKLSYDELILYMDQFPDRYDSVIALRPSGWEKNSKPQYRGRINIVGIEYSEHSSFDELKRFVQFIRPREIISTVPFGSSNLDRTPKVPLDWYRGPVRPQRSSYQQSITNFMKVGTNVTNVAHNNAHVQQMRQCLPVKLGNATEEVVSLVDDEDVDEAAERHSEQGEQQFQVDSDWTS